MGGKIARFLAESIDTFLAACGVPRPTVFISGAAALAQVPAGVFQKCRRKSSTGCCARRHRRIVGRKVLKGLGLDQVLRAGSGSAPIPAELIDGTAGSAETGRRHGGRRTSPTRTARVRHNAPAMSAFRCPASSAPERLCEILISRPANVRAITGAPTERRMLHRRRFFRTGDQGERGNAQACCASQGAIKEPVRPPRANTSHPLRSNRLDAHPMVELSLVSGVGQSAAYAMVVLPKICGPGRRPAVGRGCRRN